MGGNKLELFNPRHEEVPDLTPRQWLALMMDYRDQMLDNMEGQDYDGFVYYEKLFCAAQDIVIAGLTELGLIEMGTQAVMELKTK